MSMREATRVNGVRGVNDRTEPAVIRGVASAAVGAVAALAVEFGLPVNETLQDAIVNLLVVFTPIVSAVLIRGKVWSPASHKAAVEAAREQVVDRRPARAKKPRPT